LGQSWVLSIDIVIIVVVIGAIPVAASIHHLAGQEEKGGKLLRTENYFSFY
jgi:hypothetical protein